jgi:hypothetical protein
MNQVAHRLGELEVEREERSVLLAGALVAGLLFGRLMRGRWLVGFRWRVWELCEICLKAREELLLVAR